MTTMIFTINTLDDVRAARELLSTPGETLADTLASLGMKQSELAERMGRPLKTISEIINGKASITPDTARQLERVLGIPANFWLSAEQNHKSDLAELDEKKRLLTEENDCLNLFPVKELQTRGYLFGSKHVPETLHQLWSFFRVSSLQTFQNYYAAHYVKADFKKSAKHTESHYSLAAWLRIGEIEASRKELPSYDSKLFQQKLEDLKRVVQKQPDDFWKKTVAACNEAGVHLVYAPTLKHAPASGAAHWHNDNPIIQLSNRYKTNDHFWFAFYHESGHILKHSKKDVFVEGMENIKAVQEKEDEANAFATEMLIPSKLFDEIRHIEFEEENVIEFAKKWKTHPAIIVGRLQKYDFIPYSRGNSLKVKITLD